MTQFSVVPRLGLRTSLDAPGLAIPNDPRYIAPYSSTSANLQQVIQILGITAEVANAAARYQEVNRIENDRVEQYDRGMGKRWVDENAPGWAENIASGKWHLPDGGTPQDNIAFVRSMVSQLHGSVSPAQADEISKHAVPWLLGQFTEQQDKARHQQEIDLGQNLMDLSAGQTDPAVLQKNADVMVRDLRKTPEEARGLIGLHAMNAAIAMMDQSPATAEQAFRVASAFLSGSHVTEQRVAKAKFEAARSANQQEAFATVATDIDNLMLETARGNRPLDSMQNILDKITPDMLPADRIARYQERLNQIHAGLERDAVKITTQQQRQELGADYTSRAKAMAWDERSGGGLQNLKDETHELADGTQLHLSADATRQQVTEMEMARIAETYQKDPAFALSLQIEFLARNEQKFLPWSSALSAAYQTTVTDLARIDKNGKSAIPPRTLQAYEIYRQVHARDARLINRHLKEDERTFFELADASNKFITRGDPAGSLLMAITAFRGDRMDSPVDSATREHINSAVDKMFYGSGLLGLANVPFVGDFLGFDKTAMKPESDYSLSPFSRGVGGSYGIQNPGVLKMALKRGAEVYVRALGLDPDIAIAKAKDRVQADYTLINGWAVNTSNTTVIGGASPQDRSAFMTEAVRLAAEQYIAKHGADEPLTIDEVAVAPIDTGGGYVLINKTTTAPLKHWFEDGIFEIQSLSALLEANRAKREADAIKKAMDISTGNFPRAPEAIPGVIQPIPPGMSLKEWMAEFEKPIQKPDAVAPTSREPSEASP